MNEETTMSAPAPEIEFWFEFGSNYSYLSVMRIEDAARRRGVRIVWKPFLLGPIFRALGMETSPFVLQKEKGAYVWQDMVRQCRKYGLRMGPAQHLSAARRAAAARRARRGRAALDRGVLPPGDGAQFRARPGHQPARAPGARF